MALCSLVHTSVLQKKLLPLSSFWVEQHILPHRWHLFIQLHSTTSWVTAIFVVTISEPKISKYHSIVQFVRNSLTVKRGKGPSLQPYLYHFCECINKSFFTLGMRWMRVVRIILWPLDLHTKHQLYPVGQEPRWALLPVWKLW